MDALAFEHCFEQLALSFVQEAVTEREFIHGGLLQVEVSEHRVDVFGIFYRCQSVLAGLARIENM